MSLPPLVPPTLKDLKNSHHLEIRTLALAILNIMIQDRAPSTVKKYAASFSAWQKWAEAWDINVLPTSGPELACYLVHLLQTAKSLACIQTAAFGVAWAHNKAYFPSPLQHTMVKQLLEACKRILGTCPKTEKPHSQRLRPRNWCSGLVGEMLASFKWPVSLPWVSQHSFVGMTSRT